MFTSLEWAGFAAACRSPVLVPTQASQQAIVSAADDDPMYTPAQWEEIREMFAADDAAPSPLHSQRSAAESEFTASQWADFLAHWETPLNSQPAEEQQEVVQPSQQQHLSQQQPEVLTYPVVIAYTSSIHSSI